MFMCSALKRDVTRLGKRTKRGAFDDGVNSLRRYYINNYQDLDKQVGIDALLGYIDGTSVLGVKSVNIFKQQIQPVKSVKEVTPTKKSKTEKMEKKTAKVTIKSLPVMKKTSTSTSTSTNSTSYNMGDKVKTMLSSSANTFKENVVKFKKQIVNQSHLVNAAMFPNNNNSNSSNIHSSSPSTRMNSTSIVLLDVELDDILLKLQQSVADLFK